MVRAYNVDNCGFVSIVNQKRFNCKWISDTSTIDVKFQKKGNYKTILIVQHDKLEPQTDAEIIRKFWKRSIPNMIESLYLPIGARGRVILMTPKNVPKLKSFQSLYRFFPTTRSSVKSYSKMHICICFINI